MCGVAGFFAKPGLDMDLGALERMAEAIRHRGPDGHGALDARGVALRHARLSIIDLEGGSQPLIHEKLALIANGEIYNDPALRAEMPEVEFGTGSDCEAPLYLWPDQDADYPQSLRGMYAIAFVDLRTDTDRAALSRDPFGIKPLYYVACESGLAFASEPKALIAGGFATPTCRPDAVYQLLQTQFVAGVETIYPGIKRVQPGETLLIENGLITSRRKIECVSGAVFTSLSEQAALEKLDNVLLESVQLHQRSDVPFGLFLSGGIDSTVLLAAMAKLNAQRPIAWTARFDAGDVDESASARNAASAFKARHEVLTVTQKMFWLDLPRIVACMDDPVADYAIVPTWFLAQAARKELTVVLSGEGGDELFGGYGRYRRASRTWWRGGRRPWRKGNFDAYLPRASRKDWQAHFKMPGDESAFRAAQRVDLSTWLPDDLLIKLDRCLMAHGMEGRTPFLDRTVAECAWQLPDHLKYRNRTGKILLRRWLALQTDQVDAFARKQGFTVPVGAWIAGAAKQLIPLLKAQNAVVAYICPEVAGDIIQRADTREGRLAAWTLLFFALWHKIHIEGASPSGDVFSVLAE